MITALLNNVGALVLPRTSCYIRACSISSKCVASSLNVELQALSYMIPLVRVETVRGCKNREMAEDDSFLGYSAA
jgi:hypothetical protein